MAINKTDVILYESQRLTDEDDGGGRATGIPIIDGDINNIFPDISRLDRTTGDVALRKAIVGISTNNQDVYLGAHAIIIEAPADPNVSLLIFEASSEEDERLDAQDRIESYSVQGSSTQWELIGNQYENQRQLVAVQRIETDLPSIGDVFLIQDGSNKQYVRITELEEEITTFVTVNGTTVAEFDRRRMVLSISAPLNFTFPGGEVDQAGTTSPKSEVFSTEVADAARYWGVTRAAEPISIGDLVVKVDTIYANLVPSAQSEQPLIDQVLGYDRVSVKEAADTDLDGSLLAGFTMLYLTGSDLQAFLPRPAVRGTVVITIGGSTFTDNGTGTLTRSGGAFPASTMLLDYETGAITATRDSGSSSGTVTGFMTFRPGAAFTGRAESESTLITISNRGYNFIKSFPATKPRPGTMTVSYMVLGKWYSVRDPGNGVLAGTGVGTINFTTGTTAITLFALPDIGSSIIYSYLMDIEEETETQNAVLATAMPDVQVQLLPGVNPGGLSITYLASTVIKTITDSNGTLIGDGSGTVNYATGKVVIRPDVLQDDGTSFDFTYDAVAPQQLVGSASAGTGIIAGTLANAPLKAGSVGLQVTVTVPGGYPGTSSSYVKEARDNGAGGFIGVPGTIDYATGAYSVEILELKSIGFVSVGSTGGVIDVSAPQFQSVREVAQSGVNIYYQESTAVAVAEVSSHIPNQLVLTLIETGDDPLVPTSILFDFAGERYYDRDGIIYKAFDTTTGAGTSVGIVNYNDKTVTLDTWAGGSAPGVTIHAALTQSLNVLITRVAFRTPGAPLRPQSLSITVTDLNGNIVSGTSDVNGDFLGPEAWGQVSYETGVCNLHFTTDPNDGTGASDIPVFSNGRYSAVLYSFLPLDAELIGLDPVRLPSDGRVPFVREGDVLVISHTAETTEASPVADLQVALARDHQAAFEIIGANGFTLDPIQYTGNLITGVITFANPLTLEDSPGGNILTTPLTIRDRVEHMSMVNDVQITGEISFIAPAAFDFPATETVVSTALVWGDVNSRVFDYFTQKTWNSGTPNWTSDRIGDDTTANYNEVDNPIEYANNGAITERWAIQFTSSTGFNVVGENLGVIGTGTTSVDLAPVNPNTGNNYFIMRSAGWGGGWASGNVVRFNTEGCLAPIWMVRTVLSGQAVQDDDRFVLQIRGDAD
jgi:hypothetical protein